MRTTLCRTGAALCLAAVTVACLTVSSTYGRLSATITNTAQSLRTATMLYSHSYGSGPTACTSVPSGQITDAVQSASCTNGLLPSTSAASSSDAITANGTVASASVTQQLTIASCGAVQLADGIASNADPMLARGGMTFQATGPLTGSSAVKLDGSSALGVDTVSANLSTLLGSSYSLGIWFKVANGYSGGGALLAFGSSAATGSETSYDHVLWMTTGGKLSYGFYGTLGSPVATSPSTYNDGAWHLAVVTESSLLLGTARLYVDGTQVASVTGLTALTGYTGYWHVGWSQLSPTWDGTASPYLAGSLADAFVTASTLSGAQVSALAAAGTQASWATLVSGATHSWTLGDTGRTTFSGSAPTIGSTSPCSYTDLAVSGTSPVTSIASTKLSTLADNTPRTLAVASPSATQTLTFTLVHDATYAGVSSFVSGLILYAPATLTYTVTAQWKTVFTWSAVRTPTTGAATVLL